MRASEQGLENAHVSMLRRATFWGGCVWIFVECLGSYRSFTLVFSPFPGRSALRRASISLRNSVCVDAGKHIFF
jgi:hypothetical protein